MASEADLAIVRRAYARQVAHAARVTDSRLESALAEVPREAFLGPGPWGIMRLPNGYQETPDADPVFIYQDTPVSLLRDKRLNNGQPSFLAMLIGLCAIRAGDRVVHVGTGTGYYTALLSHLAGARGSLLGVEYEPELARRAAASLAGRANARIIEGDGFTMPFDPADAILVNAGTPRLAATWLDALKPGGRLVVPLTRPAQDDAGTMSNGLILLVTRDADGYAASFKSGTSIYHCVGASDPAAEAALDEAIKGGRIKEVTRLRREPVAAERTWLAGEGWNLTYD